MTKISKEETKKEEVENRKLVLIAVAAAVESALMAAVANFMW